MSDSLTILLRDCFSAGKILPLLTKEAAHQSSLQALSYSPHNKTPLSLWLLKLSSFESFSLLL